MPPLPIGAIIRNGPFALSGINLEDLRTNFELGESDPGKAALIERIAERNGIDPSAVRLADSALNLVNALLGKAGSGNIGMYAPEFSFFRKMCSELGLDTVRLGDGSQNSVRENSISAIVVSNPSNPGGGLRNPGKIIEQGNNYGALLIVDEAYMEFAGNKASLIKHAAENPGIVVVRTFSKFYGIDEPGKVAYAVSKNGELDGLNITQPGQAAMDRAARKLGGKNEDAARYDVAVRREALTDILANGLGCEVKPSVTNFVMARMPGGNLYTAMRGMNVRVRDLNNEPGLEGQGFCRVAVGSYSQMSQLAERVGLCK
ncbi:MAG: histidinol-phosphate aminotransferase [archaeon GW2011_AR3]|nr:MAG: histidinol-phosphate aminotransferase [archaeon GW2011_AR3]MBS3108957.1 aminotransferase class I/II-fold pyridoxal phosphate-dependent enzyme [Candidatus Woesearchaeota archaeon]